MKRRNEAAAAGPGPLLAALLAGSARYGAALVPDAPREISATLCGTFVDLHWDGVKDRDYRCVDLRGVWPVI